jgi:methylated-DNA-protein-cysteine methyltransferase related protein
MTRKKINKKIKGPTARIRNTNSTQKKETSLFELVYQVARLIPKGRVTSYGAIAEYLGSTFSARVVGWAMNGCSNIRPRVPAHRVVNRNGELTAKNHFSSPTLMAELLKNEGIKVKNDIIVNFSKIFWDPARELEL